MRRAQPQIGKWQLHVCQDGEFNCYKLELLAVNGRSTLHHHHKTHHNSKHKPTSKMQFSLLPIVILLAGASAQVGSSITHLNRSVANTNFSSHPSPHPSPASPNRKQAPWLLLRPLPTLLPTLALALASCPPSSKALLLHSLLLRGHPVLLLVRRALESPTATTLRLPDLELLRSLV